jgi:hypothetical protein
MPNKRATPEQAKQWYDEWEKHGRNAVTLQSATGVPASTWRNRICLAKSILGRPGGDVVQAINDGMRLTKTTVQYDALGKMVQGWARLAPGSEELETFVKALEKRVKGKAPKLPKASANPSDLLLEVPIMDAHFGKYCWDKETGTNYDSDLAYKLVTGAVTAIADAAGKFGQALLIIGGDYFHSDTRHNRTEASGHALDVDTRHHKVWEKAAAAIYHSVEILARTAATIKIIVIPGNHDPESAYHLQRLLAAFYRNESRVTVDETPRPRKYHRHGIVLLGISHGDKIKMKDLPSLMALEVKEHWSKTVERVWHQGHYHIERGMMSKTIDGQHSVQVEHLESIAGTDAWHHEMGFVGMPQRICGFLWSAKFGLRQRIYCNAREIMERTK